MSGATGDQGQRRVPTRESYVVWRTATTRWRDDDAYGHLNNATYYELFDTAVNAYLYDATGLDVRALPQIGVVAETGCRYFREIGFPEPIEMGLVVDKVGTRGTRAGRPVALSIIAQVVRARTLSFPSAPVKLISRSKRAPLGGSATQVRAVTLSPSWSGRR